MRGRCRTAPVTEVAEGSVDNDEEQIPYMAAGLAANDIKEVHEHGGYDEQLAKRVLILGPRGADPAAGCLLCHVISIIDRACGL